MDEQSQAISIELDDALVASTSASTAQHRARSVNEFAQLARFLYNHNPFYVISALCVFSGLWRSFSQEPAMVEAGIIALGLAVYTLLLALTAWLIVRLGVWDDARSILLIVVLMLLAISISLDPVLNAEEQHGTSFVLGGFLFALIVSEALLRTMPLRLPALFRVPYYLTIALFFLYPLAMSPLLAHPPGPALYWALFGFSAVAGAIALTLIPAVRRGAAYVNDNGSPWRWPLYPWVLFGMLGLCVCLRAYSLCVSFHPIFGTESIFGCYFLIPVLLPVTLLFVEAAVVWHSAAARRIALALPLAMVVLAMAGHRAEPVYTNFVDRFTETMHGSPLDVTLLVVVALYGYSITRGMRGAENFFIPSLAAVSFVSKYSFDLDSISYDRAWPMIVAGAIQFALGMTQRSSARASSGAACALVPLGLDWQLAGLAQYRAIILFHAVLVVTLILASMFRDRFAEKLRRLGAALLVIACVTPAIANSRTFGPVPEVFFYVYPVVPLAVALVYARFVGGGLYYAAAASGATLCTAAYGWRSYRHLRHVIAGLDLIACGILFFLMAAVVSFRKARLCQRWRSRREALE
ncbi:MAG TPA: hypothetical protein VGN12_20565 [Pirellulales bacterium]|jgi:hypothetical protein